MLISIPDVGADAHLAALQGRIHGQVDGVGGFTAVVLMNEHRVFCDVKSRGIPGRTDLTLVRKRLLYSTFDISNLVN